MSSDPDCPFCQQLATVPADLVWAFPHSVALLGNWQFYTGHCLLVSRVHATELSQLGPDRSAFLEEMATLAEAIEVTLTPWKLNYELLGNQVPHLHWHLFPRSATDPDRRQPVWLTLSKADSDPLERARLEASPHPTVQTVERLQTWLRANGAPELVEEAVGWDA